MRPYGLLVLGLVLASPQNLAGQGQLRPLAPDHWSYDLLRELDMASWSGAWAARNRPVLGGDLVAAFDGSEASSEAGSLTDLAGAWARRLREELGDSDRPVRVGVALGAVRSDAEVVQARGGTLSGFADAALGENLSLWAEGVGSTEEGGSQFRSGGLSIAARGVKVLLGRIQPAALSGLNSVVLNGQVGMDGVMVASRTPFQFSGGASRLGQFQAHFFLAPRLETPNVSRAWFASYGGSWSPAASVSFGVVRTVRFGGEGLAPFTAANVWNSFAFGGGDSPFDDSQGEFSVRARLRLGKVKVGVYGAVGFEDLKAVTEDPALLAGFSVPMATEAGLFSLGYEFLGIGARGIWCNCDAVSHSWYTQREYGPYTTDGQLLGAELGGYGAGHYIAASFWSTPFPLFLKGRVFLEDRTDSNLLIGRWPASRTGVALDVGFGPWRGFRTVLGLVTTSTDVGTERGFDLRVHALDLYQLFGGR